MKRVPQDNSSFIPSLRTDSNNLLHDHSHANESIGGFQVKTSEAGKMPGAAGFERIILRNSFIAKVSPPSPIRIEILSPDGAAFIALHCTESAQIALDEGEHRPIDAGRARVCGFGHRAAVDMPAGEAFLVAFGPEAIAAAGLAPASGCAQDPGDSLDILLAQAGALLGRTLTPALAQACESGLVGLLASATSGHLATGASSRREALFRDILRTIAEASNHHDFSAAQVAHQYGINLRTLQKLFQQRGTTFRDHVTRQRLGVALRALRDPARRSRRIADIALEAGFNDIATFNRLFRKQFGVPPSVVRQADAGNAVGPLPEADPED